MTPGLFGSLVIIGSMTLWTAPPVLGNGEAKTSKVNQYILTGDNLTKAKTYLVEENQKFDTQKLKVIFSPDSSNYTSVMLDVTLMDKQVTQIIVSANAEENGTNAESIGTFKPEDGTDFKALLFLVNKFGL